MPGLFEGGSDYKSILMDELQGGGAGLAGKYVYDKAVGQPIMNLVGKSFGRYANIASAYLYGLGIKLLARSQSGKLGMAADIAAYVPFAESLGVFLGDAPPTPKQTGMPSGGGAPSFGGLQPVTLGRGYGGTTTVR